MARGSSILSAILGGVGGGVEAGLAQRERERVARERQSEQERLARAERLQFLNAGFEDADQAGARDMPGATPRKPFATETMAGGQRVVMMQPPDVRKHLQDVRAGQLQLSQEQARAQAASKLKAQEVRAAAEAASSARDAQVERLVATGMPRNQAVRAVELEAKYGDVETTPSVAAIMRGQDIGAATARRGQDISAETARLGREATQAGKRSPVTGPQVDSILPTISLNLQRLQSMKDEDVLRLKPDRIWSAAMAPLQLAKGDISGTMLGAGMNVYADAPSREYASIIRATTDAVARASEVGVLTNQDIARYQGQVLMLPGDSPEDIRRKHNNLILWSQWLGSNKQALETGDPKAVRSNAPDSLMDEYPQQRNFIQQARSQGTPEGEIRQFLVEQQGRRR